MNPKQFLSFNMLSHSDLNNFIPYEIDISALVKPGVPNRDAIESATRDARVYQVLAAIFSKLSVIM